MIRYFLLGLLLAACHSAPPRAADQPDIRGRITGIVPAPGMESRKITGFIRIEGRRDSTTGYDKAAVTVTDSTVITLAVDGRHAEGAFADFREGDSVEASFTGPVRESYPVQATARHISILARR
ncbi:MAG: S-layer protein [Chlorobi bacterium]|nr:S-layer protein [Chlorobiota bacterium]